MRCTCGYLLSETEKICPNCGIVYDRDNKKKEQELKAKYRRHASIAGVGNKKPSFKKAGDAKSELSPNPTPSRESTSNETQPTTLLPDTTAPSNPAPPAVSVMPDTPAPQKKEPPKATERKKAIDDDDFMFEDFDENMLGEDAEGDNEEDADSDGVINEEPLKKPGNNKPATKADVNKERVINNTYKEKESTPAERIHRKQRLREEKMEAEGMEYYSNRNGYYDDTPSPEPPQDDVIPFKSIIKWACGIIGTVAFVIFLMFYA